MKRQFLLTGILIFAGICFSSLSDNSIKACGANTKSCSTINKKAIKKVRVEYIEDVDASFDMFMNPFTQ